MHTTPKPIAITPGDPGGIGLDIVLQLASTQDLSNTVIIANQQQLEQRAALLGLQQIPTQLTVLDVPLSATVKPGQGDPETAAYSLTCIRTAAEGCLQEKFSAMVTGPVNKAVIAATGENFYGHTEFLAEIAQVPTTVMAFITPLCRLALATTHVPLSEVGKAIATGTLLAQLAIIQQALQQQFGIPHPRIHVCGLNPHAGESGRLGTEEIAIIEPAVAAANAKGMNVVGPLPADTAFLPQKLQHCDAVLSLYHDQGLPLIKHLYFEEAVNMTLGLPFIRTSVDHGTAYDLAGTGKASPNSLRAALKLATELSHV